MRFKEGDTVVFQGMHNWLDDGRFTVGKEYLVNNMTCVICDRGGKCLLVNSNDNGRIHNFKKVNK